MKLEAAAVLSCLAVVLPVTHGYHPSNAGTGRRTSTAGRDAPWSLPSARWSGVTSLTRMSASSSSSALPDIPAETVAQLWSATPKALLRVGQNGRLVGLGLWAHTHTNLIWPMRPAACQVVPLVSLCFSSSNTSFHPRFARLYAMLQPITPPPTTTTRA